MKRSLKLFLLLGGIALFTVGCQLPFTKKIVTLPLLEKSPAKVSQLNKEKTVAITTSHMELTADVTGTSDDATGDMSGTFTLKADADVPAKKMQGSLTGTITAANASYNFGLDLRSLNDVAYLRLTTLPTLPGAASNVFSDITNVWYRLDPAELQNDLSNTLGDITSLVPGTAGTNTNTNGNVNSTINSNANLNLNAALNTNTQEEIFNRITDFAKNSNLYSLGERLADEKVGDVNCYHYKIVINSTEVKKLLKEIVSAEGDLLQGVTGLGGATVDQNASVDEAMEILNDMNGEIWIGKKDYLTHKVTMNLTTTQETQTLTVRVSLVSSNFNQPVTVEAPVDSKSFSELIQSVMTIFFGMMPTDISNVTDTSAEVTSLTGDEKQMAQLGSIKSTLALYHAKNKAYPAKLSDAKTFIESSCNMVGDDGYACQLLDHFIAVDVNTGQAYEYTVANNSYALSYAMLVSSSQYDAGQNTMTPDSHSLEASPNGEKDSDNDGLIDEEELSFETDDQVADTDGDGFLDGLEVLSGYNPLGDGELASLPVNVNTRLLQ